MGTRDSIELVSGVDIMQAFVTPPPPLDFIWPGYLAGTVGVLAAAGSTGKSYWSLEAAMGVCSPEADSALLGLGVQGHGRVVVLNAEDPEIILQHRLHAIGQHLNPVARDAVADYLTLIPLVGRGPDLLSQLWVDAVCIAGEGARLIVLDTLSRWHKGDENSNKDMGQVLAALDLIARQTGAAVLVLHHVGKQSAREGRQQEQQATRGASAITDNCRWQGWMQGMSEAEAEAHGVAIADRKQFVGCGGNKENYGQATQRQWLSRRAGGVLIPVHLEERRNGGNTAEKQAAAYRRRRDDI